MNDDLLSVDEDEFDDYDSEDLDWNESSENDDYLSDMWGSYGFKSRAADDMVVAHGMVQSFVNAFARDGSYVVRFGGSGTKTAGTDMKQRVVIITPAPVLDTTIDAREAGLVLTGLAVHEICHPRYGRKTFDAAHRAFPSSRVATILGNLLDDVRIERRFVADYPGYAGVFEPLLKYIAGSPKPRLRNQVNLAIAAVRFERYSLWSGSDPRLVSEREWWKSWAQQYSREDSPRRHVDGIRVALKHMLALAAQLRSERQALSTQESGTARGDDSRSDSDSQSDPEGAQDGPGDEDTDEPSNDTPSDPDAQESDQGWQSQSAMDDELFGRDDPQPEPAESPAPDPVAETPALDPDAASDGELGTASDAMTAADEESLDVCPSSATVEAAAREAGVPQSDIEVARVEADAIIKDASELQDGVDVATHYRGLVSKNYSQYVRRNGLASRFIRDALMRARSGHTEVAHYQKRGRVDNHGLTRVAHQDFRVFQRKHAPSPPKLLIWMLIDCSGSMRESSADAATVATAIADAAQHGRTTRMAVWGWSDSFRRSDWLPGVCRVWQTGQPTSDIARIGDLRQGGTPDTRVLNWAYKAIAREARNGERPIILFASDGSGEGGLQQKVAEARSHGVDVFSVALGYGVDAAYQALVYGDGNFVEWQGSIIKTARPLARLVARMVAGKGR